MLKREIGSNGKHYKIRYFSINRGFYVTRIAPAHRKPDILIFKITAARQKHPTDRQTESTVLCYTDISFEIKNSLLITFIKHQKQLWVLKCTSHNFYCAVTFFRSMRVHIHTKYSWGSVEEFVSSKLYDVRTRLYCDAGRFSRGPETDEWRRVPVCPPSQNVRFGRARR